VFALAGKRRTHERREREKKIFARYITKQKINSKNGTVEGYQKRHYPINAGHLQHMNTIG